ncbi:ATP-binding protein [Chelatococcus composti]|uniref:histidine kinase n=1 Tax=Chelatococcus composti TaxID=1743235 RepID=A0A841K6C5_9HYPH|nr:ATP-binding protein [Chelatococcus composti]MBB6168358.1 signal transduction histidine kinase [Chelatococcus composti]MBS7736559.1 sensor histidine kinase [Chelatococcus composti]GGG39411.1 ATPase [Chelatococcus composti]
MPTGFFERRSIAARLLILGALWTGVVLLLGGLALSQVYRRTSERAFDERLQVYLTDIVADLAGPEPLDDKALGTLGEPRFDLPLSGWYWQVIRVDPGSKGEMRASKSLFGSRLPPLAELGAPAREGDAREAYYDGVDGRRLRVVERVIDLGDEGRYLVSVAAPADTIESDIRQFELVVAATFLTLALVLGLTTLLQVRYGLRPLVRLRRAVGAVRLGEAERIAGTFPDDIAPLAGELNLLIDSNREILERARTQVGNLAHALKTPLSVILNEADARNDPLAVKVREQALVMRDQVNYYLERARAAALAGTLGTITEVEPAVAGIVRALERIHERRGLSLTLEVEPGLRFRGERQDLEDMVGNLADNACKWAASRVRIRASAVPGSEPPVLLVLVDDDGPGLGEAERQAAVQRGRRLDESKPGSGLGLAIVSELAGLYGGALELGVAPEGGLRASLRLPRV